MEKYKLLRERNINQLYRQINDLYNKNKYKFERLTDLIDFITVKLHISPNVIMQILQTMESRKKDKNFMERYQSIREKELTYKQRQDLPDSAFVFPDKRAYPIDTENRARNALARVAQHGTPDEQAKVKAAVKKKYPSIEISED